MMRPSAWVIFVPMNGALLPLLRISIYTLSLFSVSPSVSISATICTVCRPTDSPDMPRLNVPLVVPLRVTEWASFCAPST